MLRNEHPLDVSGLTPEISLMASLWIVSGYDMKVEVSAETYKEGTHFKALIKVILVEPSRILENFFSFHVSLPRCVLGFTTFFSLNLPKRDSSEMASFKCHDCGTVIPGTNCAYELSYQMVLHSL